MVGIESVEPTLTCEVFDYKFHKWNIPVLQEPKRKHPAQFTIILGLNIWFIILIVDILPFFTLFPYIWLSSGFCNNSWWKSETDLSKVHNIILHVYDKFSYQLMILFNSLNHLTKLKARLVSETSGGKGASKEFSNANRFFSNNFATLVRSPRLYIPFSWTVT